MHPSIYPTASSASTAKSSLCDNDAHDLDASQASARSSIHLLSPEGYLGFIVELSGAEGSGKTTFSFCSSSSNSSFDDLQPSMTCMIILVLFSKPTTISGAE